MALVLAVVAGCRTEEVPPELVLDGPPAVRVDALGPIPAPRITTSTGAEPAVIWKFSHGGVVASEGRRLLATGPGEVEVTAEWEGSRVAFTVEVELDTELLLPEVPARVAVGETLPIGAALRVGGENADVRPLAESEVQWGFDASVLRIDGFRVTGLAPGVTYVTARAHGAEAMAEIEVAPIR